MPRDPRELSCYCTAKQRCTNPNNTKYPDYGGRGIEFRFTSYQEFLDHIGPSPPGTSIDRIDNNGHYEIGNVKWSTPKEQRANQRMNRKNKFGIVGVSQFSPTSRAYVVRVREGDKYLHLYYGTDFFEACCARKSYEAGGTKRQS
jgi:hypothetical protein